MQQAVPATPETAMSEGATRRLATWIADFAPADLPEGARRFVRYAILDTIGAGLHGREEPWSGVVREWAGRAVPAPGADAASAWGEAQPALRPVDAALVNGVAIHAFELDDFCQKIHPGAPVVPAALAVAEPRDLSLVDVELAIALGYEVALRTSLALEPNSARLRGWHLTGVCGPLGAAAAAARLMGLDAEQTAWALGLAGTQSSGLFAFNADGAMSKRLHPGRAAAAGVMAAELAAAGFTGPTQVLEAEDGGLIGAFADRPNLAALTDGLGRDWIAATTNFKPYACCGSAHAYVDCAKQIRAELGGPPPADARVTAGVPRVVDVQCGYPYRPGSALNAQMSLRYIIAVGLVDGEALPAQFADERLGDPALLDLIGRIELVPDERLDALYPQHYPGWVEVEAGGRAYRAEVEDPSGHFANPGREQAIVDKFRALTGGLLPNAAAGRIERLALGPGRATVRPLVTALAGHA